MHAKRGQKHPWRRIVAYLIDCLGALGWAATLAGIVWVLDITHALHVQPISNLMAANIVASLVLVLPVTIVFALLESGRYQATLGKRLLHIRVARQSGKTVTFGIALLRNTLKVALPWILGHAAAYEIATSSANAPMLMGAIALAICAYLLPISYTASLFVGRGTTPYDAVLGVIVQHQ